LASVSQAASLINKFHLAVKATTSNVGVGRHRTNEPILGIYGSLVIVMSMLADGECSVSFDSGDRTEKKASEISTLFSSTTRAIDLIYKSERR
jgi:hypothetical protein